MEHGVIAMKGFRRHDKPSDELTHATSNHFEGGLMLTGTIWEHPRFSIFSSLQKSSKNGVRE